MGRALIVALSFPPSCGHQQQMGKMLRTSGYQLEHSLCCWQQEWTCVRLEHHAECTNALYNFPPMHCEGGCQPVTSMQVSAWHCLPTAID
eukprot:356927-Amphidinium_carterae.1